MATATKASHTHTYRYLRCLDGEHLPSTDFLAGTSAWLVTKWASCVSDAPASRRCCSSCRSCWASSAVAPTRLLLPRFLPPRRRCRTAGSIADVWPVLSAGLSPRRRQQASASAAAPAASTAGASRSGEGSSRDAAASRRRQSLPCWNQCCADLLCRWRPGSTG